MVHVGVVENPRQHLGCERVRQRVGTQRGDARNLLGIAHQRHRHALLGVGLGEVPHGVEAGGALVEGLDLVLDLLGLDAQLGDADLERKLVQRVKLFRFEAKDVEAITTTKPIDFFPA